MSKATDIARSIATMPAKLHETFLDEVTAEHREIALSLRSLYRAGEVTASMRQMHHEYLKIAGKPRSHSVFAGFLKDDGTIYPEATANGKAKKKR